MNYLAHAYLSFEDPEVLTGNLISDYIKGKKKYDYPQRILGGINLHRDIDAFTDNHPVNKAAAKIFKPAYGLYSAAFIDVAYDHFLALELAARGDEPFLRFTLTAYENIARFESIFPPAFKSLFPYMKEHNWLYNYQYTWGIEKSFEGLVHRAAYLSDSEPAFRLFRNNYNELQLAYNRFFPELRNYALEKFSDIH